MPDRRCVDAVKTKGFRFPPFSFWRSLKPEQRIYVNMGNPYQNKQQLRMRAGPHARRDPDGAASHGSSLESA